MWKISLGEIFHIIIFMRIKFSALVLLSAFLVLAGCDGGTTPADPTPTPLVVPQATLVPPTATPPPTATLSAQVSGICGEGQTPPYLKEIILTTDTQGDTFTPVDSVTEFEPTQGTFHAVVVLDGAPKNLKLAAAWYLVRGEGYKPGTQIDQKELVVDTGGTRNVDFTLRTTQDRWPPGDYCVEVRAEGSLALSKTFKVGSDSTPSNAGADVVKQIVLAEDSKPETFEPINPTTQFKSNAPFIHATIQVVSAPVNTRFRARWYPPAQEPLNFDLKTNGTRWLDFRLTPAPQGFPAGEYEVEIYVNDKLVDTKTFTVE